MYKMLLKHKYPKLTKEEIDHLSSPMVVKGIESVV